MANRSGPDDVNLRTAAVFAANNTWYACTNTITMGAQANALALYVTVGTASAGNVDFYIASSPDKVTYFEYGAGGDSPEVFGPLVFTGAATKMTVIPGICPGETIQVYFRCSAGAASATVGIKALSFESETPISTNDISMGDIEVSLDTLDDLAHAEDSAHTSGDAGVMSLVVRNDTPGTLAGTNGDYAPLQVTAAGNLRSDLTTVAGAASAVANPLFTEITDGTTAATVAAATAGLNVDVGGVLGAAMSATNPVLAELTDGAAVISASNPLDVQVTDGTTAATVAAATAGLNVDIAGVAGAAASATNPLFAELTDGTAAISASNPLDVQLTDGTTAVTVIAATAAVKSDLSSVAGTATNVNGGNRDTGTQTVTLADDDPATVSLALIDDVVATHDSAATAKGATVAGQANNAQQTAVGNGDAVRLACNLNGELVTAAHTWATQSDRTEEIDPIDTRDVADDWNADPDAATTTYYYLDMSHYRDLTIHWMVDTPAAGVNTLTVEVSNQDDATAAASCTYIDITNSWFGAASFTGICYLERGLQRPIVAKYVRLKMVNTDAAAEWQIFTRRLY